MIIPKGNYRSSVEAEFALMLEEQKQKGQIEAWEYEPTPLLLGSAQRQYGNRAIDEVNYTPDFLVWSTVDEILVATMIEVKGPKIWPIDRLKFKVAAKMYQEYSWEMWQKTRKGVWKRLY